MKTILFLISIFSLQVFNLSYFMIEGPSMEPTLQSGDLFVLNENVDNEKLRRGDVVVFAFDDDPDYYYVKRIIGLSGEKLHIKKDGIYIDDAQGVAKKLNEPYVMEGSSSALVSESYRDNYQHTYVIPEDKYFVMGDNRVHSQDSRYFRNPFIKKSNIKGKYMFNVLDYE